MRLRRVAPAVLALTALASCTYSHPTTAKQPATAPSPTVNCNDPRIDQQQWLTTCATKQRSPAGQPHTYPGGLTVQIVKLEKADPKLDYGIKPGHIPIKVTVTLTNGGKTAVPLNTTQLAQWKVLAGPNFYECEKAAGWTGDGDPLASPVPEQVAAGSVVTLVDSSDVPVDQLSVLAVRIGFYPGTLPVWTFTDAQTLLKG